MIDFARITVIAGNGGNGSGSFLHIKGKRFGKADGGDGGRGGDVYLEATADLNTLEPFRYVKEYRSQDGINGSSNRRKGADGEDLVVKVPVGTLTKVTTAEGESRPEGRNRANWSNESDVTYDLVTQNQKVLVALGGKGGRGNAHLKDEFGRRPKVGEKGEEGERFDLTLELKLIADIGIIGLPNAGKSTLLSALTSARPRIADYPFTTLEPNLGVMRLGDRVKGLASSQVKGTLYPKPSFSKKNMSSYTLVLADIPGLIEGASQGKGLGDLFLRHIERTKILVHLIDVSSESEKWGDYQTIRQELKSYSKELAKKKEIIALAKIDMVSKDKTAEILKLFKGKKKKAVAISAESGEGIHNLLKLISRLLNPGSTPIGVEPG